jgi:hypothetical protein
MRQLQARGAVRLDATVSLLGPYAEDDERRRWRIVITGIGPLRTFSGRTVEEALQQALHATHEPVGTESDPFPSSPPEPYR